MDRIGADGDVHLFCGTSEEAARSRNGVLANGVHHAGTDSRVIRPPETNVKEEAAPRTHDSKIGLLFIDGSHNRHLVVLDIDFWEPIVNENGLVCSTTHQSVEKNILGLEDLRRVNLSCTRRPRCGMACRRGGAATDRRSQF